MIDVGQKAPDFQMKTDGNGMVKLSDFLGRNLVIYFYPKDDTPGCTTESCDFRESLSAFNQLNCAVIGVSKDSVESHNKFKAKYSLNFPLASDENGAVCEAYGVWKEKSMFGKKYMGIDRATFLIDKEGIVQGVWRSVSVGQHVQAVLEKLKEIA